MLSWVITFFLLAIVASVFGFWGLAGTFSQIAQFLAILFVVLFLISAVFSLVSGKKIQPPQV